jgi:hypothetical protein
MRPRPTVTGAPWCTVTALGDLHLCGEPAPKERFLLRKRLREHLLIDRAGTTTHPGARPHVYQHEIDLEIRFHLPRLNV